MTSPQNDPEVCRTCDNSRTWHQHHLEVMHPFNDGSVSHRATFGRRRADGSKEPPVTSQRPAEGAAHTPWPFDPVLRQALINKGVLTPQDLRDAEEQIRSVTAQFEKGVQS